MDIDNRGIPRSVLTEICWSLGYNPEHVLTIEADAKTIAVTRIPPGVTGIEGVTTVHKIIDGEV